MTDRMEPVRSLPEGVPLVDGIGIVDGLPRVIDREEYNRRWAERQRDREFFETHRKEFLKQYPDQWVAVYREGVVATAATRDGVYEKLDALGIRRAGTTTHFMNTNPMPRII